MHGTNIRMLPEVLNLHLPLEIFSEAKSKLVANIYLRRESIFFVHRPGASGRCGRRHVYYDDCHVIEDQLPDQKEIYNK